MIVPQFFQITIMPVIASAIPANINNTGTSAISNDVKASATTAILGAKEAKAATTNPSTTTKSLIGAGILLKKSATFLKTLANCWKIGVIVPAIISPNSDIANLCALAAAPIPLWDFPIFLAVSSVVPWTFSIVLFKDSKLNFPSLMAAIIGCAALVPKTLEASLYCSWVVLAFFIFSMVSLSPSVKLLPSFP